MNFHQKPDAIEGLSRHALRYEPVPPSIEARRTDTLQRLFATYSAPIFGWRAVFPRRFDKAFRGLIADPTSACVIPEHAIWYYGEALHLDIDPATLGHRISDWVRDARGVRWVGSNFLDAADWSGAISALARSPVHREMQEIVRAGSDYRDSSAYRNLLKAIELGRPSQRNNVRLATVEAVEAYLRYCRGLIKSMRKRGAVRHRVSGPFHGLRVKHRAARSPVHDSTERDIGVAIAENGEIIRHLGGKHRTAIAQALKLPTIPVEIRMVHVSWLAREIERTGLPPHQALAEGVRRLVAEKAGPKEQKGPAPR